MLLYRMNNAGYKHAMPPELIFQIRIFVKFFYDSEV